MRMAFVAAGGTGGQMIVVLDGTRDAPGGLDSVVQRWPAGQAAASAPGLFVGTWLIRDSRRHE